jgi:hypothetical protein
MRFVKNFRKGKWTTTPMEKFCDILGIPMFGTAKKMLQ